MSNYFLSKLKLKRVTIQTSPFLRQLLILQLELVLSNFVTNFQTLGTNIWFLFYSTRPTSISYTLWSFYTWVVPSISYLLLTYFSFIIRIPIIGANSLFFLIKQWSDVVLWIRTSCTTRLAIQGGESFQIFSEAISIHAASSRIFSAIPYLSSSNIHNKHY